jgi:aryl-alcohol dehydrogenase (NADP+)
VQYVRLGATGLKVSRLCLGTLPFGKGGWRGWALSEDESRPVIQRALELGINFFDTANSYSDGASEEVLGRALSDFARREEVVVATKVYRPTGRGPNERGLSRKHILASIDASLRRLGMDYVDLYQIHRWDPETSIEEVLWALDDVVRSGKARYVGACTMTAWQFAKALFTSERRGWSRFVSMQCQYNLLYREEEREMLPLCESEGAGVLPYSPLARGLLSGSKDRLHQRASQRLSHDEFADLFYSDARLEICDRVIEVASGHGTSPANVALAWILQNRAVSSAIVGPSRPDHIEELVEALELNLSIEDTAYLEELYRPRRHILT